MRLLRAAACLAMVACFATAAAATLTESGSTLLKPLMDAWVARYTSDHGGIDITTNGTGSGAGIADAIAGRTAIGASDAFMSDEQLRVAKMIHVPVAIGSQEIDVNVPETRGEQLRLNGSVLSAIYSGRITMWNDPQILALNPALVSKLPHHAIVPVRRSDSSGDTFLFTQYLSATDKGWKRSVGYGTEVEWPSVDGAVTAKGNAAMVDTCASASYCIAYVGISYAERAKSAGLQRTALQNQLGEFVLPQSDSILAAVQSVAQFPNDARLSLIDVRRRGAYPIVNLEYAIVRPKQDTSQGAQALRDFLTWIISPDGGQRPQILDDTHLLPLTPPLISLAKRQIAAIH